MLDELLTPIRETGRYYSAYDYPEIPDLTSRADLLTLHRDLAQWTSKQATRDTGTVASAIVQSLYRIATSVGDDPAAESVQQAVQHVITALRANQFGWDAQRELDAARIWVKHARLASTQGHR